ncbi:hypothetical protein KI688_009722 [Linnemannia hyalina]|uniref:RNI-like protein n=1 Tax=Linnemannia hyalina TaxID=64524 RepID=A0A9P7XZY0_9FUNG|nr:hypothetical protein KI688_009722 [Linnemannia hyalina]
MLKSHTLHSKNKTNSDTNLPQLQQRIAHKVDGEILTFQAPVEVLSNGQKVVILQPILDLFPDTAALCRKDKRPIPFLTNEDDVLLVPVRVEYGEGETYFVVPCSGPPPPPPPRSQPSPSPQQQQQGHAQPASQLPPHSTEAALLAITQETPVHDLPVPRLFVVLPAPRPRDWNNTASNPSSSQSRPPPRPYRLYFLCDCGPGFTFPRPRSRPVSYHSSLSPFADTGSTRDQNNPNVSHNNDTVDQDNCIHIADQQGYDIPNLRQFSDQFGEYTLMLLRAFQQGINTTTARGTVQQSKILLPPVSQRHYSDVLQPFTWDIEERVSTAIATFEALSPAMQPHNNSGINNDALSVPTIDLHRLWECVEGLKRDQENRVQAMRRMFVNDGTVRWLCEAHYQSTFGYVGDDRDMFLWRCQEIVGDEGDLLSELSLSDPAGDTSSTFAAGAKSSNTGGGESSDSERALLLQPVAFDYQGMHLRLTGSLDLGQIGQLKVALKRGYMVHEVTLTMGFPNSLILMAIADLVSDSTIGAWNVSFVGKKDDESPLVQGTADAKDPFTPPPYSSHESSTLSKANTSLLDSSSDNNNDNNSNNNNHNTTLHALHSLLVLGNLKRLRIPDLDAHLYHSLAPAPGEFPQLRQLHVWGSNPLGQPSRAGVGAWAPIRPAALLKAFGLLTELRITGIYLGSRTRKHHQGRDDWPDVAFLNAPLYELVESLVYLPNLSVLELSACGLLQENCGILSRSLTVLETRLTHLDIHDNWLEDEGLAELLWTLGPRGLFSLDARNCGFGNKTAFALASILQAHTHEADQELQHGLPSQMPTFRILKLQETYQPHLSLYHDTQFNPKDNAPPSMSRVPNQLSLEGRQHLIQALELLNPLELCLSFKLGFTDTDFASAFAGMKSLESLEKLTVADSKFGVEAVEAMKRRLQATSCQLREVDLRATGLTPPQQQEAFHQFLNI